MPNLALQDRCFSVGKPTDELLFSNLGSPHASDIVDLDRERLLVMENKEEQWRELCALAAVEQDPGKLMKLVKEISRLLAEKQKQSQERSEDAGKNDPNPPGTSRSG